MGFQWYVQNIVEYAYIDPPNHPNRTYAIQGVLGYSNGDGTINRFPTLVHLTRDSKFMRMSGLAYHSSDDLVCLDVDMGSNSGRTGHSFVTG